MVAALIYFLIGATGLGTLLFNMLLISSMVPAYFVAKIGGMCLKKLHLAFAVVWSSTLSWRFVLFLCSPWIRIRFDGLKEYQDGLRQARGRPRIVVANHVSFLDTILCVAFNPLGLAGDVKMFTAAHLLKIPVLGTIIKAMDHYTVPFKATSSEDSDNFKTDKDVVARIMERAKEWLRSGHMIAWFPEGRLNPGSPLELGQFRAGGFTLATEVDAEIWVLAFVGNDVCWPRKSSLGGSPSHIHVKAFRYCESTRALLAQQGSSLAATFKEKCPIEMQSKVTAECWYLADDLQTTVQKAIDGIKDEGWASIKRTEAASQRPHME